MCDSFKWPTFSGPVLVVGLGGGADIITAYALATWLVPEGTAVYANTKKQREADLVTVAPHIARLPEPAIALPVRHGTTAIDRLVPRGAWDCPWILFPEPDLVEEIRSLDLDWIVGVDTGGDVLAPGDGRDRRVLELLRASGHRLLLVVVGLGADGQESTDDLRRHLRREQEAGRYLGRFSLAPLLETFRHFAPRLPRRRTPRILLDAAAATGDEFRVPRGCRPVVPRDWLLTGMVFDPGTTRTRLSRGG